MSDETTTGSVEQGEGAGKHQTIMSRILEYQRQLREGDPPPPPVETLPDRPLVEFAAAEALSAETADLVDLTEAEAAMAAEAAIAAEAAAAAPEVDVEAPAAQEADVPDDEGKVAPVVRLIEPKASAHPASGVWAIPDPPERDERNEAAERLAELENTLRDVSKTIGELRQRFQDMAVASDERLAELEQIIERARRSTRS
ncbi:MAG TPA: hypothetical protein VFT27_09025 [Actinomycetota bacterium]|nr:hypothetical protein [Actinomycetota bacterium]